MPTIIKIPKKVYSLSPPPGTPPGGGTTVGIIGSGTINKIAKFSAGTTITDSQIFDDGTGIGINTITPSAQLDIVAPNNGPYSLSIRNNSHTANTTFGYKIYQETDGRIMSFIDGTNYMTVSVGGSVSYSKHSYTSPADTQLITESFAVGNASYALYAKGYLGNNGLTVDGDGNVGINQLTAGAKLHIKGIDSTSSNYALKIDNSASSPLLYVRNNGQISAPSLPTSNTGLVTGDIYVDTAANILANGDKVVGWKV